MTNTMTTAPAPAPAEFRRASSTGGLGAKIWYRSASLIIHRYASRAVREGDEFEVRFGGPDGPVIRSIEVIEGSAPVLLILGAGRRLLSVERTHPAEWRDVPGLELEGITSLHLGDWNRTGGLEIRRNQTGRVWFHDPDSQVAAYGPF